MKIFWIILILICSINPVFCKDTHCLKYNGIKYSLQYSTKDKENNGYLNEYFKPGESYDNWSEMVAVYHFPNIYSPINQLESFRDYLNIINCPNAVKINEDKNYGIIDFIMLDSKKLPIIIEFNVFKYEKSPVCGTIAVQYAKRYLVTNNLQINNIKKDFKKIRKNTLKKIEHFEAPPVVEKEIDAIKLNDLP